MNPDYLSHLKNIKEAFSESWAAPYVLCSALTCWFNQKYVTEEERSPEPLLCPSSFCLFTSFFFLSLFLSLSTSCQLMRACRWLVMNSDEHLGQICFYVCVRMSCYCKDLQPSVSVPAWHSCIALGGDILIVSTTATLTSFTGRAAPPQRRWGSLGERRASKDRGEEKLTQGFGKGRKEIQIDQDWGEEKMWLEIFRTSFIQFPSAV